MVELGEDQGHDSLMGVMEALLPSSTKRPAEIQGEMPSKQARGKGKGAKKGVEASAKEAQHSEMNRLMARLLISIEDSLNTVMLEMEFMLFTQVNGQGSLGETAVKISAEWHQQMENKDPSRHPLRMVMFTMFVKELELRMRKTLDATETGNQIRKEFMDKGLMSADGQGWNYMRWDADQAKLIPTSEAPLPVNEAIRLVALVQELAQQPNMILRFCALRALAKTDTSAKSATKSNIVPWKLTIAMRAPRAQELHQALQTLSRNSIMQLILARLRPATLQRSPLAKTLAKYAFKTG